MTQTTANGPAIRKVRKERGRSLRDTADAGGITAGHLSYAERGERAISEAVTRSLAEYFGVPVDELTSPR